MSHRRRAACIPQPLSPRRVIKAPNHGGGRSKAAKSDIEPPFRQPACRRSYGQSLRRLQPMPTQEREMPVAVRAHAPDIPRLRCSERRPQRKWRPKTTRRPPLEIAALLANRVNGADALGPYRTDALGNLLEFTQKRLDLGPLAFGGFRRGRRTRQLALQRRGDQLL